MKTSERALSVIVADFGVRRIAITLVLISSLLPNDRARAEKESWNNPPVSDLVPGQVLVRDISQSERREYANGGWSPKFGARDILIRDQEGVYYSYRVPTWKNAVVMPFNVWGQWDGICVDLGPELEDGMLKNNSTIQCNSAEYGGVLDSPPRWSIDGRSLVSRFPDLPKLRCKASDTGKLECF